MAVAVSGVQAAVSRNMGGITKVSGDGSFASMISASMSKQASSKISAAPSANNAPKADASAKPANNQPPAVKDGKNAAQTAQSAQPDQQIQDSNENLQDNVQKAEEQPDMDIKEPEDAVKEAVKEVLGRIKNALKDILDLNDEEIGVLMEQMGITMAGLLDPQVLQQFVVKAAGEEDVSALLMDEGLSSNYTQLLNAVQQIVDESGFSKEEIVQTEQQLQTEPEDFSDVLWQTKAMPEQTAVQEQAPVQEEVKREDSAITRTKQPEKPDKTNRTNKTEEKQPEENKAGEIVKKTESTSFEFESLKEGERGIVRTNSPQTKAADDISPAEQFLDLVSNAAKADQETKVVFSELTPAQQIREIANQILEKVRIIVNPAQTSMELTLNPASLGKVSLNLIAREGVMTAHFTAQTQVAREAIESQMVVLRENLENQGIKVDAIEVTVSNFEFTQSDGTNSQAGQNGRQQRRNITLEEADFLEEVTDEEAMAIDILARSGNQVDYTA